MFYNVLPLLPAKPKKQLYNGFESLKPSPGCCIFCCISFPFTLARSLDPPIVQCISTGLEPFFPTTPEALNL